MLSGSGVTYLEWQTTECASLLVKTPGLLMSKFVRWDLKAQAESLKNVHQVWDFERGDARVRVERVRRARDFILVVVVVVVMECWLSM